MEIVSEPASFLLKISEWYWFLLSHWPRTASNDVFAAAIIQWSNKSWLSNTLPKLLLHLSISFLIKRFQWNEEWIFVCTCSVENKKERIKHRKPQTQFIRQQIFCQVHENTVLFFAKSKSKLVRGYCFRHHTSHPHLNFFFSFETTFLHIHFWDKG